MTKDSPLFKRWSDTMRESLQRDYNLDLDSLLDVVDLWACFQDNADVQGVLYEAGRCIFCGKPAGEWIDSVCAVCYEQKRQEHLTLDPDKTWYAGNDRHMVENAMRQDLKLAGLERPINKKHRIVFSTDAEGLDYGIRLVIVEPLDDGVYMHLLQLARARGWIVDRRPALVMVEDQNMVVYYNGVEQPVDEVLYFNGEFHVCVTKKAMWGYVTKDDPYRLRMLQRVMDRLSGVVRAITPTRKSIEIPDNNYLVSLTKLVGSGIKDIWGYITSYDGGDLNFVVSRILFANDQEVRVEAEHDYPYLSDYGRKNIPNLSEEVLETLRERDDDA